MNYHRALFFFSFGCILTCNISCIEDEAQLREKVPREIVRVVEAFDAQVSFVVPNLRDEFLRLKTELICFGGMVRSSETHSNNFLKQRQSLAAWSKDFWRRNRLQFDTLEAQGKTKIIVKFKE